MEIEQWVSIVSVIIPVIVWGIRRYLRIMADGAIDLEEGLETIVDGYEIIDEVIEDITEIIADENE